jgi:hypothetical protein
MRADLLWYKSWLDTRWRFVIGLALLTCAAVGIILARPRLMELLTVAPPPDTGGALGKEISEAIDLAREYRGYVWSQWFSKTPIQMGLLFAALLGSGGMLSQGSGGQTFTLSLPASRQRLVGVRAGIGLGELLLISLIPSLLIPLTSAAIGERYGLGSALVHAACLFAGSAVFFSAACFLSTVFDDLWRPLLITLAFATALAVAEALIPDLGRYTVLGLMRGEQYFRTGQIPWIGILATMALSLALLYAATVNLEHRDF